MEGRKERGRVGRGGEVSPGHVDVPVARAPRHLAEGNPHAHRHHQREGDHASDHVGRAEGGGRGGVRDRRFTLARAPAASPAVLLLQRLEVGVGLDAHGDRDRHRRVGPDGGVVVVAGVLVQPVALVLAAEAVVAGAAAVDVAVLGAVEGVVEVAHHVVVAPGGRTGETSVSTALAGEPGTRSGSAPARLHSWR